MSDSSPPPTREEPKTPARTSAIETSTPFIGGKNWQASDVFWGTPGREGAGEIVGYWAQFPKRGRPSDKAVTDRCAEVWDACALYCLNSGSSVIYVGEGRLGERLKTHMYDDACARRWDSFSWIAPAKYKFDDSAPTNKASIEISDPVVWSPTAKQVVEFMELVAIQFGMPTSNRQLPELGSVVTWLEQFRSSKLPLSDSDMIKAVYDKLINGT